jgi:hypothetical protein
VFSVTYITVKWPVVGSQEDRGHDQCSDGWKGVDSDGEQRTDVWRPNENTVYGSKCAMTAAVKMSPWGADSWLAGHDIPYPLWKPKVHYRVHNSPLWPYFFKICFQMSPNCPVPLRFSDYNGVCVHLPSSCHMSRPSHLPWFDCPNNIWWSVHVMKLLITQSSPVSHHFLLGQNILLSTLSSNTSLTVRDQSSHPYKTTGKLIVTLFFIV